MSTSRNTPLQLSLLGAAALQLGASDCGTPIIRDPGFDLWCGDQLCTWKVVRGDARPVATWHEDDLGIELVGDDSAIAQLAPVDSSEASCIRFDLIADVADTVDAQLGLDIFGDGTIDHSERIPASRWKPLSFHLKIDGPYAGIRFVLSKRGTGRAVFAQIAADRSYECGAISAIVPGPAPLGAPCSTDADCASERCELSSFATELPVPRVCVGCVRVDGVDSCAAGSVCGAATPISSVQEESLACTTPGSRVLGERCYSDAECATQICNQDRCSTCRDNCGEEACGALDWMSPSVCSPGKGRREAGEPCAYSSDCASAECVGEPRRVCLDGRACGAPDDCPVFDDLSPGPCLSAGVQGGTCR